MALLDLNGRVVLLPIAIIIVTVAVIKVTNPSFDFLGNGVCSFSISARSTFSNSLAGIGRALINDKYFNAVPLWCHTNGYESQDSDIIEKRLAKEIENCYKNMGQWRANGLFPMHSFLCSVIIYDAPLDDYHYVNLTKVYEYLLNDTEIPNSTFDFDTDELDARNYIRFCMPPIYESGIICNHHLYYGDLNHQSVENFCDSTYEKYNSPNGCLSLKETVLNGWQFDLLRPISPETANNAEDVAELCYDIVKRQCGVDENNYEGYRACVDELNGVCDQLKTQFIKRNDKPFLFFKESACQSERCEDFLSRLEYEMHNFTKVGTNKTTVLRRGTFYIRFYDYTDWLQKEFDSNWNRFPECNNDIIYRDEFVNAISIAGSDIELKHDYIAIGYVPYIDYRYLYRDQFDIDTNIVQVSG